MNSLDVLSLTRMTTKQLREPFNLMRFNEHIEGDGPTVFAHACKLGLEGIVSKRKDSAYRSGRSQYIAKQRDRIERAIEQGRSTEEAKTTLEALEASLRAFERQRQRLLDRRKEQNANHRHRRLLGACRARPRGRCAAEERDESSLFALNSVASSERPVLARA